MFDYFHKQLYTFFIQPFIKLRLKKEELFYYKTLKLKIYPTVFHPAFFFSSLVFAEFLEKQDLKGMKVCEVGAGSGLLSFIAFSKGAATTALDINPTAVKGIQENLANNFRDIQNFHLYLSDLFDQIPLQTFDMLLINPPYFFKNPNTEASFAWYCGENGEYFTKLFSSLSSYTNPKSQVFMILADNCDINNIKHLAGRQNYVLELVFEKKIKWEKNTIFKLIKNVNAV